MKVLYEATIEDYLDVMNRYLENANPNNWFSHTIWLSLLVCVLAMLVFRDNPLSIFILTISFGFCFAILYLYLERKGIRDMCRQSMYGRDSIPVEFEITEEGISCKQLFSKITYFWDAIIRIEETKEAVYFHVRDRNILSVRKRGFESDLQAQEFTALINNYFDFPRPIK